MAMAEHLAAFDLTGRVAVVTGASNGIGRGAAVLFAAAGARVVLGDIDEVRLAETAAMIGPAAVRLRTDVSSRGAIDALAKAAVEQYGKIDIWANVAGAVMSVPLIDATEEQVDRLVDINLKGTYWGCAAAARAMKSGGGGSIINISSNGADSGPLGMSIYAMTKSGVNGLTRSAARELGPFGVRANVVSPGFVETPLASWSYRDPDGSINETKRDQALELRRKASPLGAIGAPSDIAYAMLYLASDASRFVTGQNFRINGGVGMPL